MRYLIASVLCFLLAPTQVHACRGAVSEDTLFFEIIPDLQPAADLIAKVKLSDFNIADFYKGSATARILQVITTTDERVQQDGSFVIKFMVSSCGPHRRQGGEGTIVAKASVDSEGHIVLYPYVRRYSDDLITAPCIGKIKGKITDSCSSDR